MTNNSYEMKDFNEQVYLHYNDEKFWEVKVKDTSSQTIVRCGKLTNGVEDQTTIVAQEKSHSNIIEAISYAEKHINIKLSKGYRFTSRPKSQSQPQNVSQSSFLSVGNNSSNNSMLSEMRKDNSRSNQGYSINIIPPSDPRNLKRRQDSPEPREDLKYTKVTKSEKSAAEMQLEQDEINAVLAFEEAERLERLEKQKMQIESTRKELSMSTAATSNSTNNDADSPDRNGPFRGGYLTKSHHKGTEFYKVQVLRRNIKIQTGIEGDIKSFKTEYNMCVDLTDALDQAKNLLSDQTAKGYRPNNQKFVFDFQESEIKRGFLHHASNNVSQSRSAPASPRGGDSPVNSQSRGFRSNNLNLLSVDDEGYSDTSRRSAIFDNDDDNDDDDKDRDEDWTDRPASRNTRRRGRSASATRDAVEEEDDDDSNSAVDLGDAPLGKGSAQVPKSVLLAHKWEGSDPSGWYMSEKLDGVRCYWTGRSMWSRNGKQYFPPKFFTKDFPKSPLDGELWIGRSTFQKCVSVVRKHNPIDSEWRDVKYMVFDAPALNKTFKDRYKIMTEVFSKIKSPYIRLHEHNICRSQSHLNDELEEAQKLGGEGMMIRDPKSYYENRRSRSLLKVKTFDDAEAVIIGYEEGKGRNQGVVGALRVRNDQGIEFSVGSGLNDAMRANPPKKGTKITYKFQGVSNSNTPRFPTFLRIYRGD